MVIANVLFLFVYVAQGMYEFYSWLRRSSTEMCCDMHVHWSLMYSAKWKTVPWCCSSGLCSVCNRWASRLPQSYGFAPSAKLHHMHTFCSQLTVLRLSWRWLPMDSNTLLTSGIGEVPSMQTSISASRTVFATFEWLPCRCKAAGYMRQIISDCWV